MLRSSIRAPTELLLGASSMVGAMFLLLCGMLAAEVALFGIEAAGIVGASCLVACALLLAIRRPYA